MENKIILSVFALFLFSAGCDHACRNLTWEAKESSTNTVGLRISAGDKCGNYNDYYEGDLNKIIKQIQSMKIVLNRKCTEVIEGNDPEEVEIDCPEFVPETIEFGEMVKCEFQTPPNENTDCKPYGPALYFKSEGSIVGWQLIDMDNPRIIIDEYSYAFEYEAEGVNVGGSFKDDSLEEAMIKFIWTEGTEEKTLEFSATVETKE
jgi:hypothetical protein